nr:hypothetical protein [Tanacetum cinerariifolium]
MFPPTVEPRIHTVAVVYVPNTTDRKCIPISKVFDHFRNMRATSDREKYTSQTVFDRFRNLWATNDQAKYTSQTTSCSRLLAVVGSRDRGSVYIHVVPVSKVPKAALA